MANIYSKKIILYYIIVVHIIKKVNILKSNFPKYADKTYVIIDIFISLNLEK